MSVDNRPFTAVAKPESIRMALKFSHYTYREAAMRAKVHPSLIGHLVTGHRKTCNPESAGKIAKALKADTADLFVLKASRVPGTVERKVAA